MQAYIDLGSMSVESKAYALALDLHGSAVVAPSEEDAVDSLQTKLNAWKPNEENGALPWITCDRSLELILHLEFDDAIDTVSQEHLMELLSTRFQNAEVLACTHVI